MKKLKVIIEQTKSGYSGYFNTGEGFICSTGKTIVELFRNMGEAYTLLKKSNGTKKAIERGDMKQNLKGGTRIKQ